MAWLGAFDRVRELSCLAVAAMLASTALSTATAYASPTPSPALETTLAPAPDGFTDAGTGNGILQGPFSSEQFASTTASGEKATETVATLHGYGFIGGYAHTWIHSTSGRGLVEIVMAFSGAQGASRWLRSSDAADHASATYQRPLSLQGVPSYSGAHFVGPSYFADAYALVKGNDFFWVIGISRQDDVSTLATTQARSQYDQAPSYTIPPSEWPESRASRFSPPVADFISRATALALAVAVVAGVCLTGLGVYVLFRRRTSFASGRRLPPAAG